MERRRAEAAVLEANAAFYQAFARGDDSAMSELWARRAPVACVHPGALPLSGRNAVLASWRRVLSTARSWRMACRDAEVHLFGDCAFVTCLEANGEQPAHLAATNIFVLEDQRWRLVHHQAGPLSSPHPLRRGSLN